MANIPVYCSSCNSFFVFKSLIGGDGHNITLENLQISPCPNCGGTGRALDGTYNFIGDSIEFLSGPNVTIQKLKQLASILRKFQEERSGHEDLQQELDKKVPEFSKISTLLPTSKEELYAFVAMLLTLISLLIQQSPKKGTINNNIEINQVINQINQADTRDQKKLTTDEINKSDIYNNVGRNDPCPCNSGKKYKHCHGK